MKERDAVADAKETKAETKPEAKTEKPATAGPLGRAAESSDPAVHQLLAERQTAVMNDDKDAVKAATAELNKLGFE